MGLSEHIREGATLVRETKSFLGQDIQSSNFGASYIILGIEVDKPCRIRFYDNQSSASDLVEITRSFGDTPVNTDIALIADISMSVEGKYTMDPVLYAVPSDTFSYLTHYNITDSDGVVNGNLLLYKLEDDNIQADVNNEFYRVSNRRTLIFNGNEDTLNFIDDLAPRTYLIIDALSNSDCRLRIYANRQSLENPTEITRNFDEAILTSDVVLLADIELAAGNITKFFPKIIGSNLQTLSSNIELISLNRSAINSIPEIYYRLEPSNSTVSMNIYSLED
jgi:hypothetical protein